MRLLVSCLLVGTVLSGCSSSGSEPAPDPTVDERALTGGLAAMYAGDNPDPEDVTEGELDTRAYAGCLAGELDPNQIRASVVASLMGEWEDPALARLSEAQTTCADQ